MGADLLGRMVVGPHKLDTSKRAELLAGLKERLREGRALRAELANIDALEDAFDATCLVAYGYLAEHFPDAHDELRGSYAVEEILDLLLRIDPEKTLDNLYALWNGSDEVYFRDSAARTVTDELACVFCGCMSWGDEPDGLGYTTLRDAEFLGFLTPLGCR